MIQDIDLLLFMTVNPGFGGQKFIPNVLPKIEEASRLIHSNHLNVLIEVDGGINEETAKLCKEAGAHVLQEMLYIMRLIVKKRFEVFEKLNKKLKRSCSNKMSNFLYMCSVVIV